MAEVSVLRQQERPAGSDRRHASPDMLPVRGADLEPQRGIRYVARLFKTIAVLLVVVMVFELALAAGEQLGPSIGVILGEAVRLLAFAALLWGGADLAVMLIKSHHDLRATRILLTRQTHMLERLASGEFPISDLTSHGTPEQERG
jgi:hypothetical protein